MGRGATEADNICGELAGDSQGQGGTRLGLLARSSRPGYLSYLLLPRPLVSCLHIPTLQYWLNPDCILTNPWQL